MIEEPVAQVRGANGDGRQLCPSSQVDTAQDDGAAVFVNKA
jgi:hypothetical protein